MDPAEIVVMNALQRVLGSSEPLERTASLYDDLGLESLTTMTVIFEIVSLLEIDPADLDVSLADLRTVADLIHCVNRIIGTLGGT